jgi:hypothetical protein
MKTTRNQTDGGGENRESLALSTDSVRKRLEDYVREEPLKAIGQAAAAGFILRFLPLRSIFMTGVRLAAPLMLLNRIWAYTSKDGSGNGVGRTANRPESREKTAAR